MAVALLEPERVDRLLILDMAPANYAAEDGSAWGDSVKIIEQLQRLVINKYIYISVCMYVYKYR